MKELMSKKTKEIFGEEYELGSMKRILGCAQKYTYLAKCSNGFKFIIYVYSGKVVRGYHCPPVQQPYWNTIYLDDFPDEELLTMIDHAYDTVFSSLSKKVQKQILEEA